MNKKILLAAFALPMLVLFMIHAPAQEEPPSERLTPSIETALRAVGEEIRSLRTETMEVYKGHYGTLEAHMHSSKRHYFDEEDSTYEKIELTVREVSALEKLNPFRECDKFVDAGSYRASWFDDAPHDYTFRAGEYYVKYTALHGDVDTHTVPYPNGVKQFIYLNDAAHPVVLKWCVETNARMMATDATDIRFEDMEDNFLFRISSPVAWDSNQTPVPVYAIISGDTLIYSVEPPEFASYPVTVDPGTIIDETDAKTGELMNSGSSFSIARNAATSNEANGYQILVGMWYSSNLYHVSRCALVYDSSFLPKGSIIDSAKVVLVVHGDGSETDFNMVLTQPTFTGDMATGWFNDFTGWASSGTYSTTNLSEAFSTSGISDGDSLRFVLNSAGLENIDISGETRFMLMSQEDINNSSPGTTYDEYEWFEDNDTYIQIWYRIPIYPPSNFQMTAPDSSTIACSWEDNSDNEERFYIINWADSSIVDSTGVNAVADTIGGLNRNTKYIWAVVADSAGVRAYSDPDSVTTLLPAPEIQDIIIMPISSDTLRIELTEPVNPTTDDTGMEVYAVSGSGTTSSGWLTGTYFYLDGGLDPYSSYVYRMRYRNADGTATDWSPDMRYSMNGLDTLVVYLAGDESDDYTIDFGNGMKDSTVVRVGASDTGDRLDGYLTIELPWQVQKGGIDSLFLHMTRTDERSETAPTVTVYGIPEEDLDPVEGLNPGALDSTSVTVCWTINTGEGEKKSPDLRGIFRAWQDLSLRRDYHHGFGLRLDDSSQADNVRAVFLDASHPSYNNGTWLTVYYTPGSPDTLDGCPGDFTLTVMGPDSLRAEWTDNSTTEYGYVICNLADSSEVAVIDSLDENTTSVEAGGLVPNTVYQWYAEAFTAYDYTASSGDTARTVERIPGFTTVSAQSDTTLRFIVDPLDNPAYTCFAVQDSITGRYIDGTASPHILRAGPVGEWGWRTYEQWGGVSGDILTGVYPDSLYVLRAKAKTGGQ